MPRRLVIVGMILIEWILLAAELSGRWQYYIWAAFVFFIWTEAIHKRRPDLYPKRGLRIGFLSVMYFFPLFVVTKMYFFVLKNGIVMPVPPAAPGGVIDWLPHIFSWF